MRAIALAALAAAVILLPVSVGLAAAGAAHDRETARQRLTQDAQMHARELENAFERAHALTTLTSREPAFRDFYAEPGSRDAKLRSGTRSLRRSRSTLYALRSLNRSAIQELCFIDRSGAENARVVYDWAAPYAQLSRNEYDNPFFAPTFATPGGEVYQSPPYLSPDTGRWVIGNSAQLPARNGRGAAIVHFELTLESLRLTTIDDDATQVAVVDARTGRLVLGHGWIRGDRPIPRASARLRALATDLPESGLTRVADRATAARKVVVPAGNANRWVVFASERAPSGTLLRSFAGAPVVILGLAVGLLAFSVVSLRASRRELQDAALTDALTGLPNRRCLMADLEQVSARSGRTPAHLLFFDLDGFKAYNDAFGHPAGDALLARLGQALVRSVGPAARAYRLGGDEFCVLATGQDAAQLELASLDALSETGEGFDVTASIGAVELPTEARDPAQALRVADTRMYANKAGRRAGPERQTADALLRALAERDPGLGEHTGDVTDLTIAVGRGLGLGDEALGPLRLAAELHDVGKLAIPDSILGKPGPLDEDEWVFMRRHTTIGERICAAAPGLAAVAPIVRSSHERWDGGGYPDGLSTTEIPLGARIVAVCDAYDAMTSDRAYREPRTPPDAIDELRRCAGTQFDPAVVEAFVAVIGACEPAADAATPA